MKLPIAALLIGSAVAFSPSAHFGAMSPSALQMSTAAEPVVSFHLR